MGDFKFLTMSLSVLFIFDPLLQSEQRAKDVEKSVDQHADSARKAVDAQERGDTPP